MRRRARLIGGETRLVGLIGKPLAESLSPRMQNAAFAARGLDWAYVPLEVEPERLEAAVGGLVALKFAGANVTAPFKEAVVPLCDELDPMAARAGSVNTLVVRDDRVLGTTTDGEAVAGAVDAAGARILVLGAGGAARAVALALAEAGAASVAIAARNPEPAEKLVANLAELAPHCEAAAAPWPPRGEGATLLVNATPVRDEAVVTPAADQQVVDLAYRLDGGPTVLVEAARRAGCAAVVDGLEVLVRQGAASFERWTGIPAPLDVMRASLWLR